MKKILQGKIISDKTDKTKTVEVLRLETHPVYKKKYRVSKKYLVHDQNNKHKIGELVKIEECRPRAKRKRWRII